MCSIDNPSNNLDIEDLINDNKNIIIPNYYQDGVKVINHLLNWINSLDNPFLITKKEFGDQLNKSLRLISNILSKVQLYEIYRIMIEKNEIEEDENLSELLQKKSRNISGITNITLVFPPYPNGQSFTCKHDCFYCPNEPPREENNFNPPPRSYLTDEPAVKRGLDNGYDAIKQMNTRMNELWKTGNVIDKIELIFEGGTVTEFPEEFLEKYFRDVYYAANKFGMKNPPPPGPLIEEMIENKTANVHIIGFCLETRPDAMDNYWIKLFRRWGVTRIQLGVQHIDNYILKKVNRGHTIEQAEDCIERLRDECFKLDIHLMPDLPNSNPELDKLMFDYVYSRIHPDQIKIYPCQVTPWTKIKKWYDEGKYMPYGEKEPEKLVEVVKHAIRTCPYYVRHPRIVRDIPLSYVHGGTEMTNLREYCDRQLEKEGFIQKEIRAREIGRHKKYYFEKAKIFVEQYNTKGGREYFISYESHDRVALFGFIRLRLPNSNHNPVMSAIKNMALIRELHVYGQVKAVGSKISKSKAQHKGIGKKLISKAEMIAMKNLYKGVAIISGEGVKSYYEDYKFYIEKDTYMIKYFTDIYLLCFGIFLVFIGILMIIIY